MSKQKQRKILRKSTQLKSNENKHVHSYLPPFGIVEKRMIEADRLKHGFCNHHLFGNGGKTTCDTFKYMVR